MYSLSASSWAAATTSAPWAARPFSRSFRRRFFPSFWCGGAQRTSSRTWKTRPSNGRGPTWAYLSRRRRRVRVSTTFAPPSAATATAPRPRFLPPRPCFLPAFFSNESTKSAWAAAPPGRSCFPGGSCAPPPPVTRGSNATSFPVWASWRSATVEMESQGLSQRTPWHLGKRIVQPLEYWVQEKSLPKLTSRTTDFVTSLTRRSGRSSFDSGRQSARGAFPESAKSFQFSAPISSWIRVKSAPAKPIPHLPMSTSFVLESFLSSPPFFSLTARRNESILPWRCFCWPWDQKPPTISTSTMPSSPSSGLSFAQKFFVRDFSPMT
mmetsp:Transcript_24469/g.79025  ORF Transcript_24469/g.79025 Transcript_24469/m.79025 type:complete len:323 (-) Transcript_24469:479-1447(-)